MSNQPRLDKLENFILGGTQRPIKYIETIQVKEGVEGDVYSFVDDDTKDLAIVRVQKGFKTPLQRILKGNCTTEGYVSGKGSLTVTSNDGTSQTFDYDDSGTIDTPGVVVEVGQLMQWSADNDLEFYEICDPPYEDGRFENLKDESKNLEVRKDLF